jgi:predicted DNA-binding protein with PD1-like motif
MKYIKDDKNYLLVFEQDELLIKELENFIKTKKIKSAWFNGLGAAKGAEIGFYNLTSKEYQWQSITKLCEITNITGNISWQDDMPVVHSHTTLTDINGKTIGGHVKELVVGGTCEIYLLSINKGLQRRFDESTGLNLLDL